MFLGSFLILDQRCVATSRPGLAREGVQDIFFLQKESKPNKISSGAELLQVQVVGLLGWRGTTKRTGGSLYMGGWFWVDDLWWIILT